MEWILFIILLAIIIGIGIFCFILVQDKKRMEIEAKELQSENQKIVEERVGLDRELLLSQAELKLEKEKMIIYQKNMQDIHNQNQSNFENLANKIFDEKNNKFKHESSENLNKILSPFKEKLYDFQRKIDVSFSDQAKEQFSLKEQIEQIVKVNHKMREETESLTNALKGSVKVQGSWGELVLERLLEESGLRKDQDYIVQGMNMKMRSAETGVLMKPDVVIKLPDNKNIIVDSKVSLVSYQGFCDADNEIESQLKLSDFLQSIKNHIKNLESKKYETSDKVNSPDFVIMFMPIEGAYSLALQKDQDLHNFAWSRKIILVSPTTLFATLKTIASMWRLENQNRNVLEIARQGGALYDKIAGFHEDMQKLDKQLQTARNTYDGAMKKLANGQGNILSKTEKLKALGASTTKSLPVNSFDLIEEQSDGT